MGPRHVRPVPVASSQPNTIPEPLSCSLDIRHPDLATLESMEQQMRDIVAEETQRIDVGVTVTRQNDSPPVEFAASCVANLTASVEALGYSHHSMFSGAVRRSARRDG